MNGLYSLKSRTGPFGTCATEAEAEAYFWEQSKQWPGDDFVIVRPDDTTYVPSPKPAPNPLQATETRLVSALREYIAARTDNTALDDMTDDAMGAVKQALKDGWNVVT